MSPQPGPMPYIKPCRMQQTAALQLAASVAARRGMLLHPSPPGDSNMKATTSADSSAFIVMTSSLPAHLSILFMLFRFRPAGARWQEEGWARTGQGQWP